MSKRETPALEIVGYADKMTVRPGATLNFMVSSKFPEYTVRIERLIHGDPNPAGPGFKSEHVKTDAEGKYKGEVQGFRHGSFIVVKNKPLLKQLSSFTIQCWIYPTMQDSGVKAIAGQWSENGGSGYGLFVDGGVVALRVRDSSGATAELRSQEPVKPHNWYFVAASFDQKGSKGALVQQIVAPCAVTGGDSVEDRRLEVGKLGENGADLMIGAFYGKNGVREESFNGKIDGLKVFSKALTKKEIEGLKSGKVDGRLAGSLVGHWDFAHNTQSATIKDLSKNRLSGTAVNLPQRAVTGHNWSGNEPNFQAARDEYNAIRFHDDDQGHAGWKVGFTLKVPKGFRSGVYAAHLEAKGVEDYVPFYVIPPKGTSTSTIAYLAPTFSYMAYSNERTTITAGTRTAMGVAMTKYPNTPQDAYIVENVLTSLYDHHTDGSGVCYVSNLRPILNFRPKYNMPALSGGNGAPHQFNADLHLVDWLEAKGYEYDTITDEDLHNEGGALIGRYKVIVTGSHPEYWSEQMLDTMSSFLNNGGRLMYLGGNGFYWVTTVNPEDHHVFEVRRWGGTGTWNADPGEFRNSSTGEVGGLWKHRGRAPQKMLGVGFTSQGFDANRPYTREKGSFDERAAFIFEGIGKNELIGDFPSLVQNYGAAGFELDRLDHALGTPPHSIHLASSTGFSNNYQHVLEEETMSNEATGGQSNPKVNADLVYVPYPKGGGVFSVGSIAWCGSLSHNGYDNTVSKVTGNVLTRFASREPLT